MEGLKQGTIDQLREFYNSGWFNAYREWTILEAGKCIGEFRVAVNQTPEQIAYLRGKMFGIEKFFLDMVIDIGDLGNVEKNNKMNMDYTKDLVESTPHENKNQ